MAYHRFAWGIDIGNRALKAIKLVRDGDSVRVDDFDVIEHETVLSNSGDNRDQLITNALTTFVAKHPMKGGAVAIGVSGQSSFARFIKLPPVEDKKIPEIVRFEAIQQIPFPLDDVEWSYQLFRSPDSPDVEVGIFAMRKELINQHITQFTEQDLNVQVVQMNPLAVYNAMQFDQRIEGTTMIIDMGAENTDLIIADADSVWLRSIPIGGNNFTEALVKSFKLNFAKAEDLKRNAATSKYARQIFQAMRPVFADLVAEVQRSIGFYASVHRDSRIKKILAVGGTFKLPGLQKYLQQNLQLEVERLDTLGAGAPPDPKQAANFQDNILSLVSSYGLALQAMGEGKITSSLLPQRIRRERLWQEKQKYFAAAAALFVLGTGIGYGSIFLSNLAYEGASTARGTIQGIQTQATDLDNRWSTVQNAGAADRQRILNIRSLTDYRDLYANILNDIHAVIPAIPPADQLKQTPRNERKIIRIDSITTRYLPDMSQVTDLSQFRTTQAGGGAAPPSAGMMFRGGMDNMGGAPAELQGMMDGAAAPAPVDGAVAATGGRGFVLVIDGVTPYRSPAAFLNEAIVLALQKSAALTAKTNKKYKIDKAEIVYLKPLKDDQQRLGVIKGEFEKALRAKESGTFSTSGQSYGGAYGNRYGGGAMGMESGDMMDGAFPGADRGFGGIGVNAGAGMAEDAVAVAAFKDRQFSDEDIRDDQTFTAVVTVLLDPAAPTETPTDGTAPAEGEAAPAEGEAAPAEGAAPVEGAAPTEGAPPPDAPAAPATPAAPAPSDGAPPDLPAAPPPTGQ